MKNLVVAAILSCVSMGSYAAGNFYVCAAYAYKANNFQEVIPAHYTDPNKVQSQDNFFYVVLPSSVTTDTQARQACVQTIEEISTAYCRVPDNKQYQLSFVKYKPLLGGNTATWVEYGGFAGDNPFNC
jgi:hypothetical protein